MDNQRPRPSRGKRRIPRLNFSLAVFERKLRTALGHEDQERECGEPGSSSPDFTGGTRRALITWLFSCLLSKYDDQDRAGAQRRISVAMEKFWQAEEKCFWTNFRFCQSEKDILKEIPALALARETIRRLLGEEVPLSEIARGFGHGKGSTTRLPRSRGDAVYKYSTQVEVTPNALALGNAAILANPIWTQMFSDFEKVLPLTTVWGNRVITVPKNYKTDRVIAVEPDLNMYVQKGLGALLRRRLKRVGVDLDDQTLNQTAAQDLSNATIDFSMASDLVSQGLVSFLLPPNWRDLIASMRCEVGVIDNHLHRWSKVSSMGNGFTFELESMIFYALATAVVPVDQHHRIRVYGDDVILPTEFAESFMALSRQVGFIPNYDKSFWTGPFRESCGKHYFNGRDVTPFYIKEPVTDLPQLFLLHNKLWRWLQRADPLLAPEQYQGVRRLLRELRSLAPAKWRKPTLPDGFGDDAFIGSFQECNPSVEVREGKPYSGWEAFVVSVYSLAPEKDFIEVPDGGALVKADKILRQRRWILPQVYSVELSVEPVRSGKRRHRRMAVPWWAWG